MGLLSMFKNLNLGFGMLQMPTTTSADTIEAKELQEVEDDNTMRLAGDHQEITSVDKDTGIRSDETGSCTIGMDWKFNHPSMELNFLGLPIRPGEKECSFYMRTGGCKFARLCRFHHPDPTAVVGDSFQDRKNGVPSQRHGPVEQLCETPRPSENSSNEQTAFLGPFTPNRGLLQNVYWNGNQTATSPLHRREMNVNGLRKTLANKDTAYKVSGGVESQQFEVYPQRPGEPECQRFMKTGYCKFKSACRYHHPKSNVSFLGLPQRPVSNNYQHHGPVEQLRGTPLPTENTSNEQTAFLGPSSSYVPDLLTPNQGLKPNAQWNGNQTATSPLHPREMNVNDLRKTLANKDTAYEFGGGVESQQFEEYPQRPGEPECQHFTKTGYCKFKSACRYHHPKSNVSFLGLPQRPVSNNYQHHGPVEQLRETPLPSENTSNEQTAFLGPSSSYVPDLLTPNQGLKPNPQWNGNQTVTSLLHPPEIKKIDQQKELANKDATYEVSGGEPQQFDEYPQRPSEPECQYFKKTGYCKFKSACKFHHPPKSNPSFLGLPLRPASNNYKQDGPVEQLCEMPLPSESTSNEQTAFVCPSSSNVGDLFTPNWGLQPNVQWNGNQTVTSLLHPPELKIIDQQKELANKDAAYEVSGCEPQQFDKYPQRPSEPDCQYFMKTGYCKFKSECRFHHPKSNPSFLGLALRPASNNDKQDGPVEQWCEMPLPSESTSNEQTAFVCPSSSNVAGLFTPNRGLQPNVQWNGDQMSTSPLHPPEIKINEEGQELANKDAAYEFSGGLKSQRFDEYPQRPGEPECQYFMKTGYCMFKSACRCHHPKSNLSFPDPPLNLMDTSPLHPPDIKINEQGQELANKDTAYEFCGGVKLQQFDEYPQRPGEPECHHFMKTGYCKFKSACRLHHPKSNLSFPAPPLKPDKPICTHYSRHGICKFGSACRFNHHMERT